MSNATETVLRRCGRLSYPAEPQQGAKTRDKLSKIGALPLLLLGLSISLFRRFSIKSVTSLNKSKRKTRGQNGTQ